MAEPKSEGRSPKGIRMNKRAKVLSFVFLLAAVLLQWVSAAAGEVDLLDKQLSSRLRQLGFTGKIEATLEQHLGRPIDRPRANLGRLLWFDTITGLHND